MSFPCRGWVSRASGWISWGLKFYTITSFPDDISVCDILSHSQVHNLQVKAHDCSKIALIINNTVTIMVKGKTTSSDLHVQLMSSRGLLEAGICYFPLVHSISYSPVWFYMFSCLFKLPTPLLMSSMSAPTLLAILREQKPSEEDICQFPHLAVPISPPSIPSALMSNLSTWVWFQLPLLSESRTLFQLFPLLGKLLQCNRWYHHSVMNFFFYPSHIYRSWNVLDKTVETESNLVSKPNF